MKAISNYSILEQIAETQSATVYRAVKEGDEQTYIIKVLKIGYPGKTEIVRFKREYRLIQKAKNRGIIEVYDIMDHQKNIVLVLEDFPGIPLQDLITYKNLEIADFLRLASGLSEILGSIHQKDIIHKDIKPSNILVTRSLDKIKITDFGISALQHTGDAIFKPGSIEESLVYMSPEQTGRMNMEVDYRTDIYSLGITFYQILTGTVPFYSDDPLGIIHAHIAKKPVPPSELDNSIPGMISRMVMKMLEKNPEDRYQNCYGLKHDLDIMAENLEKQGDIPPFDLGTQDRIFQLTIPRKVVGREKEVALLVDAFNRVCGGSKELFWVYGNAGVGKTALVLEINRFISEKGGYFINGKYNPYLDNHSPYRGIIQAFHRLVIQILSESDDFIAQVKGKIIKKLGIGGKVIIDILPDLELIIGPQPTPAELTGEEAKHRFERIFEQFISVLATREHPLVLFLDDLQWCDPASLDLIEKLMASNEIKYLFIIGSYRDDIKDDHPLHEAIKRINAIDVPVTPHLVQPLGFDEINELVALWLRCTKEETLEPAKIIKTKTEGNPFFVIQFIKMLYDKGAVTASGANRLSWDIDKIKSIEAADTVGELLTRKINLLAPETRELLKLCACIDYSTKSDDITIITGQSQADVVAHLEQAIEEGIISFYNNYYTFTHDRVQEECYNLMDKDERSRLHCKIGMTLYHQYSKEKKLHTIIFFVVNQLEAGKEALKKEEQPLLISLSLQAGTRALRSTAYNTAVLYYNIGINLLDKTSWQTDYPGTYKAFTLALEAAHFAAQYDIMAYYEQTILDNGKDILDRLIVYRRRLQILTGRSKFQDALTLGLDILAQLGLKLPKKPGLFSYIWSMLKVKIMRSGLSAKEIGDLPDITDPMALAQIQIIQQLLLLGFWKNPFMYSSLVAVNMRLILKYGNSIDSAPVFISFAYLLSRIGRFEEAYRFANTAFNLINTRYKDNPQARLYRALISYAYNIYIRHWKEGLKESVSSLLETYHLSLELGSPEYAGYAIVGYCNHAFLAGYELKGLNKNIKKYMSQTKKMGLTTAYTILKIFYHAFLKIMTPTVRRESIGSSWFNVDTLIPKFKAEENIPAIYTIYLLSVFVCYHYGEYEKARRYVECAESYKEYFKSSPGYPGFIFLKSLLALEKCRFLKGGARIGMLKKARSYIRLLKKWAGFAPMNQMHRYYLVEAELAGVKNNTKRAIEFYNMAIQTGKEKGFIQDLAIIYDRTGSFYYHLGLEETAAIYFKEALFCYSQWGAAGVVDAYEERFLFILEKAPQRDFYRRLGDPEGKLSAAIDLKTLKKSLKFIVEEPIHSKMIEHIITSVMQFAGAQKGILILPAEDYHHNNSLCIEACMRMDWEKAEVMQSIPIEKSGEIPLRVINFVKRTKESVLIGNAGADTSLIPNLSFDPYIKNNKVKSILCLPITERSVISKEGDTDKNLIGMVYLENNFIVNAFSQDIMEVLEIICVAAAGRIELSKKAATDGLTGLYNHDYFQSVLDQQIAQSQIHGRSVSLMMVDIDNFKSFNDTWGHQFGDVVLKNIARGLKLSCKNTDIIARYGGEEMAVILPETSYDEAMETAETIRYKIAQFSTTHQGEEVKVTASFGVSSLSETVNTKEQLIKTADDALYRSKKEGRNRVTGAY